VFDASEANIADLLAQASGQTQLFDVETHRAPIDDVIADIYEQWHRQHPTVQSSADSKLIRR
jgi:hypothetical protein